MTIIAALAAAFSAGSSACAQPEWKVTVGYAVTSFSGSEVGEGMAGRNPGGLYIGAARDIYFSTLAGLTFEPGAYFYYQSTRSGTDTPKYMDMYYLSFPANIKYSLDLEPSVLLGMYTGPVLDVGLFGNTFSSGKFITNTGPEPMRRINRVALKWDFGAALTVSEAVQIHISYALGVSRRVQQEEIYANTLSVGVSFIF